MENWLKYIKVIPGIFLHVILDVTGKRRLRSERLPVGGPQQSQALDTGSSDNMVVSGNKAINHVVTQVQQKN